jgi:hypothetical protein
LPRAKDGLSLSSSNAIILDRFIYRFCHAFIAQGSIITLDRFYKDKGRIKVLSFLCVGIVNEISIIPAPSQKVSRLYNAISDWVKD